MWWKILGLLLAIVLIWGEKVENSEIRITRIDAVQMDTTSAFVAWSDYFASQGIAFSDIVTAQFLLETKYGTSQIYKENNNLFGMKYRPPKKGRKSYAIGTKNEHAYYASRAYSVAHYNSYQKNMLFLSRKKGRVVKTEEDYFKMLERLPHCDCRYAEDTLYIPKLRRIIANKGKL